MNHDSSICRSSMPAEVDSITSPAGLSRRTARNPAARPLRTLGRHTVTQTT